MEREDGAFEYQQPTSPWREEKPLNSIETQPVAAYGMTETSTVELLAAGSSYRTSEPKTQHPAEHPQPRCRNNLVGQEKHNDNEDIPPGFGTPCNGSVIPSDASSTAPDHQEREISDAWTMAPGVQFPPLPSCAPVELDQPTSARCVAGKSSDTCLINQTFQQNTKTCSMDSSHVLVANFQQGGSYSLGRKFFRQHKFTHRISHHGFE